MSSEEKSFWKKLGGVAMTPEAHLVDTYWFRAAIAIPILIALGTAWFFTNDTDLSLAQSPEGMNTFLQLFKLPLGIAGLALPIVAVVAANHRSMQTAQQIKEQNSQNIFSNHLEHRDFFAKFVDERRPFGQLAVETARLYEALFPKAVDGDLRPNKESLREVFTEVKYALLAIANQATTQLNEQSFKLRPVSENTIRIRIEKLENLLSNKLFPIKTTETNELQTDPVKSLKDFEGKIYIIVTGLVKCANFHRYYIPEDETQEIKEIYEVLDEHHNKILPLYRFYKTIELAANEYLDERGSLKRKDGKDGDRFRQRLRDTHESMVKNDMSIEPIQQVFDHHLNSRHRLTFYLHAPEEWKEYLILSPNEREQLKYIIGGRA